MKLQKKLAAALIAAVVCSQSITAISANAWISSYELDYTIYIQQKSNWCWAACSETMSKYDYPNTALNQSLAVRHIFGTESEPFPNVPGSIFDVETASEFITHNAIDYHAGSFISMSESHFGRIVAGHSEVLLMAYSDGGAHTLTLSGMYIAEDSTKFIRIADPSNGMNRTVPYTLFTSGDYMNSTPIAQCQFYKNN